MSHQIIKQPNGLYAIWSDVVDDFTMTDCTPEDIIEQRVKDATEEISADVWKVIRQLEKGGKPYNQFTMTYEKAQQTAKRVHRKRLKAEQEKVT